MEFIESRYYDHSKFSNTFYLTQMALQMYFANDMFRSDASRVIYASPQYAFRQRLNLNAQSGSPSIDALKLPFMSYFRKDNYELDPKVGALSAVGSSYGYRDIAIGQQLLRFIPVETNFDCWAFFYSDQDAQLAYETLLFIKYPTLKQFPFGSITYKNTNLAIPISLNVDDLEFNPGLSERDWLKSKRIIPIHFNTNIKSVSLSQQPQSPESDVFQDEIAPVITKKVILDFLSYKYGDDLFSQQNIVLEVDSTIPDDPDLEGTFNVSGVSNSTISVAWSFNPLSRSLYTDNVTIACNNGVSVDVPMDQLTYTLTGLTSGSLYNIFIYFISLSGSVTKYTVSQLTSTDSIQTIKGIKGY
jgi:hypothetical protein